MSDEGNLALRTGPMKRGPPTGNSPRQDGSGILLVTVYGTVGKRSLAAVNPPCQEVMIQQKL